MKINAHTKLDIDQGFKVEAGPGAGKTQFLVNHIKNVIITSEKLDRTRKVACITYTNTAVETVMKRLGKSVSNRVDVSTIHSFLYKNVVKPYCSFLPTDYEVNIQKFKGHYEPTVINSYMREWLENADLKGLQHPNTKNQLLKIPDQSRALQNWLLSMKVCYDTNNLVHLCNHDMATYTNEISGDRIRIRNSNLDILQNDLLSYKKICWRNGHINHEDILFFSYILIKKHPFILTILRAKYPYFFIDEYQDTNPVQAFIINEIKKENCIVGVIGDKAQSIYSFQGAQADLFENFEINQLNSHSIIENHRSTYQIVTFLNDIRSDITQTHCNDKESISVSVLVGDRNKAFIEASKISNNHLITSLSRDNVTSNAMKISIEENNLDKKMLGKFKEVDSNSKRINFILPLIHSIELAMNSKYKEAIKKIEWFFKENDNSKQQALSTLSSIIKHYSEFRDGTLMDFYNTLKSVLEVKLPSFRKGKIKTFYETTSYYQLAICVNIVDDISNHITVHKAKGDEFENVLVIGNKDTINLLKNPNLENDEEQRIFYVAMSRAKERLFIQFDWLSEEEEILFKKNYNLNIITQLSQL